MAAREGFWLEQTHGFMKPCRLITYWPARSIFISGAGPELNLEKFETRIARQHETLRHVGLFGISVKNTSDTILYSQNTIIRIFNFSTGV